MEASYSQCLLRCVHRLNKVFFQAVNYNVILVIFVNDESEKNRDFDIEVWRFK